MHDDGRDVRKRGLHKGQKVTEQATTQRGMQLRELDRITRQARSATLRPQAGPKPKHRQSLGTRTPYDKEGRSTS